MVNPLRVRFFGIPVDPWTRNGTIAEIERRLDAQQFTQHAVVNVAKIVHMQHDESLRNAVLSCDIINVDGMGVLWGARFLGLKIPERVTGIDLFLDLLALAVARGEAVFFLGAKQEVVEQTVKNLQARIPALRIADWHHGYFWDDEQAMVKEISRSGATFLFVAITSPKKEKFINRYREKLGVKFVMGVGGAFDIMAGITQRAPTWMQRVGFS